eukprot:m.29155 g.29155  ORF g.29155 m.29155 type:complete len:331 (+) comp11928_c0_seq1:96-1088(+)
MDTSEDQGETFLEPKNERCPHCQTTRYQKQEMVMYTSLCGHFLCDSCLGNLFHGRAKMLCPTCKTEQRREDYQQKIFDSGKVHRDVVLRQKRLQDMNLTLANFDNDLSKFNDYLELREDIAFNLSNNTNIAETKARMEQFFQEYQEQITANKHKAEVARRKRLEQRRIELDMARERRRIALEKAEVEKKRKQEEKTALMEALMRGVDPKTARKQLRLKREQEEQEKEALRTVLHTGTATLKAESVADDHLFEVPKAVPLYHYQPLSRSVSNGPAVPATPAFALSPYRHAQEAVNQVPNVTAEQLQAGGYRLDWTMKRAMQEAFASLFELN